MIYTITFNPSLDYIVSVENFELGRTNRTSSERMLPGGKGLNVSMVLANFGIESTALGFTAGFTGAEITRRAEEMGLQCNFIPVKKGLSRINLKLTSIEGTEINGRGPEIDQEALEQLTARLDALGEGDILVLAGSVPVSVPRDIYGSILEKAERHGVITVVDAESELLCNVLSYHPFLVKPNHHELGEIFDVKLWTREEAIPYAQKMQEMGARNVLVSLGGEGAVLAAEDGKVYETAAPGGEVKNTVGAGDSMVAGFLAGWLEKKEYGHAFRMSVAAGSASAFSELLATREEMEKVYQKMLSDEENLTGTDVISMELSSTDSASMDPASTNATNKDVKSMDLTSKNSEDKDSTSVSPANMKPKEKDTDVDALIALLDGYTQAGESRIKLDVVEGSGEVLSRKYHHGRCDVGSPWACGTAFDVLE